MCAMDMSALALLHFAWKGAAWTIPDFGFATGFTGFITLFVYSDIFFYIYIYICVYIYIYLSIYLCIHACIHTYIHTYLHTYVRTYIHAYIHVVQTKKIVIDNMSRHMCLSENSRPPCFENPLVCQCLLYLLYIHWCINPIFRYTQASPSPPIWRITPLLS